MRRNLTIYFHIGYNYKTKRGYNMEDSALIRSAFSISGLFRGVDPQVVRSAFLRHFQRGEAVSEIQHGIECVGVVVSGSLGVEANEKSSVSVLRRGGEFGICNIFVREKMPTKLWARVRSEVLFIPKEEFARLLGDDSALMYRYVKLCNEKMIYLAERLRLLSVPNSTERLLYYLQTAAEGDTVRLKIPKDELARQIGISRASLFRAISALEDEGKISVKGNQIILHSHENSLSFQT